MTERSLNSSLSKVPSLLPQSEFEVIKTIVLREKYLQKLKKKMIECSNANKAIMIDMSIIGLIDVLRSISVDAVEIIRKWEQAQLNYPLVQPFLWNGINYLEKMSNDYDFLNDYDQALQWLQFSPNHNPFVIPPDILFDGVVIDVKSYLIFGERPKANEVVQKKKALLRLIKSPYVTPIINDPMVVDDTANVRKQVSQAIKDSKMKQQQIRSKKKPVMRIVDSDKISTHDDPYQCMIPSQTIKRIQNAWITICDAVPNLKATFYSKLKEAYPPLPVREDSTDVLSRSQMLFDTSATATSGYYDANNSIMSDFSADNRLNTSSTNLFAKSPDAFDRMTAKFRQSIDDSSILREPDYNKSLRLDSLSIVKNNNDSSNNDDASYVTSQVMSRSTVKLWTPHEVIMQQQSTQKKGGELYILTAAGTKGHIKAPWRRTRFQRMKSDLDHMAEQSAALSLVINERKMQLQPQEIDPVTASTTTHTTSHSEKSIEMIEEMKSTVNIQKSFLEYQYNQFKAIMEPGTLGLLEKERALNALSDGQAVEQDEKLSMSLEDIMVRKIQFALRRKFSRVFVRIQIAKRNKAAVVIQMFIVKVCVAYRVTRHMRATKLAYKVQKLFRGGRGLEYAQFLRRQAEEEGCILLIQRYYRGYCSRKIAHTKKTFLQLIKDANDDTNKLKPGDVEDLTDAIDEYTRDTFSSLPVQLISVLRTILYMINGDNAFEIAIELAGVTEIKYVYAYNASWNNIKLILDRKGQFLRRLRHFARSCMPPGPIKLAFSANTISSINDVIASVTDDVFDVMKYGKDFVLKLLKFIKSFKVIYDMQDTIPNYYTVSLPLWFKDTLWKQRTYETSRKDLIILQSCLDCLNKYYKQHVIDGKHYGAVVKTIDMIVGKIEVATCKCEEDHKALLTHIQEFHSKYAKEQLDLSELRRYQEVNVSVVERDIAEYIRVTYFVDDGRIKQMNQLLDFKSLVLLRTVSRIEGSHYDYHVANEIFKFPQVMKTQEMHDRCTKLGMIECELLLLNESWVAFIGSIGGLQFAFDLVGSNKVTFDKTKAYAIYLMNRRRTLIDDINTGLNDAIQAATDYGMGLVIKYSFTTWDRPSSMEKKLEHEENITCARRAANLADRALRIANRIRIPPAPLRSCIIVIDNTIPSFIRKDITVKLTKLNFIYCDRSLTDKEISLYVQKIIDVRKNAILVVDRGIDFLTRRKFRACMYGLVHALIPKPRVVLLDATKAIKYDSWHSVNSRAFDTASSELILGRVRTVAEILTSCIDNRYDEEEDYEGDEGEGEGDEEDVEDKVEVDSAVVEREIESEDHAVVFGTMETDGIDSSVMADKTVATTDNEGNRSDNNTVDIASPAISDTANVIATEPVVSVIAKTPAVGLESITEVADKATVVIQTPSKKSSMFGWFTSSKRAAIEQDSGVSTADAGNSEVVDQDMLRVTTPGKPATVEAAVGTPVKSPNAFSWGWVGGSRATTPAIGASDAAANVEVIVTEDDSEVVGTQSRPCAGIDDQFTYGRLTISSVSIAHCIRESKDRDAVNAYIVFSLKDWSEATSVIIDMKLNSALSDVFLGGCIVDYDCLCNDSLNVTINYELDNEYMCNGSILLSEFITSIDRDCEAVVSLSRNNGLSVIDVVITGKVERLAEIEEMQTLIPYNPTTCDIPMHFYRYAGRDMDSFFYKLSCINDLLPTITTDADALLAATVSFLLGLWTAPVYLWLDYHICIGVKAFVDSSNDLYHLCDMLRIDSFTSSCVMTLHRLKHNNKLTILYDNYSNLDRYEYPTRYLLYCWCFSVIDLLESTYINGGEANDSNCPCGIDATVDISLHDNIYSKNIDDLVGKLIKESLSESLIVAVDDCPIKVVTKRNDIDDMTRPETETNVISGRVCVYQNFNDIYLGIQYNDKYNANVDKRGERNFFATSTMTGIIVALQPNSTEIFEGTVQKYDVEEGGNAKWYDVASRWLKLNYIDKELSLDINRSRHLVFSKIARVSGYRTRIEVYEEMYGEYYILMYNIVDSYALSRRIPAADTLTLLSYCDTTDEKGYIEKGDIVAISNIYSDRISVKPRCKWVSFLQHGCLYPQVIDRPVTITMRQNYGPGYHVGTKLLLFNRCRFVLSIYEITNTTDLYALRIILYSIRTSKTIEYRLSPMERMLLFNSSLPLLPQIVSRFCYVLCDVTTAAASASSAFYHSLGTDYVPTIPRYEVDGSREYDVVVGTEDEWKLDWLLYFNRQLIDECRGNLKVSVGISIPDHMIYIHVLDNRTLFQSRKAISLKDIDTSDGYSDTTMKYFSSHFESVDEDVVLTACDEVLSDIKIIEAAAFSSGGVGSDEVEGVSDEYVVCLGYPSATNDSDADDDGTSSKAIKRECTVVCKLEEHDLDDSNTESNRTVNPSKKERRIDIKVVSASNLSKLEGMLPRDAHCRVKWNMRSISKSKSIRKSSDPVWEYLAKPMKCKGDIALEDCTLEVEVYDHMSVVRSGDFLGKVSVTGKELVDLLDAEEPKSYQLERSRLLDDKDNMHVSGSVTIIGQVDAAKPGTFVNKAEREAVAAGNSSAADRKKKRDTSSRSSRFTFTAFNSSTKTATTTASAADAVVDAAADDSLNRTEKVIGEIDVIKKVNRSYSYIKTYDSDEVINAFCHHYPAAPTTTAATAVDTDACCVAPSTVKVVDKIINTSTTASGAAADGIGNKSNPVSFTTQYPCCKTMAHVKDSIVEQNRVCYRGRIRPPIDTITEEAHLDDLFISRSSRLLIASQLSQLQVYANIMFMKEVSKRSDVAASGTKDELPVVVEEVLSDGPSLSSIVYRVEVMSNRGVKLSGATIASDDELKGIAGKEYADAHMTGDKATWIMNDIFDHIVRNRIIINFAPTVVKKEEKRTSMMGDMMGFGKTGRKLTGMLTPKLSMFGLGGGSRGSTPATAASKTHVKTPQQRPNSILSGWGGSSRATTPATTDGVNIPVTVTNDGGIAPEQLNTATTANNDNDEDTTTTISSSLVFIRDIVAEKSLAVAERRTMFGRQSVATTVVEEKVNDTTIAGEDDSDDSTVSLHERSYFTRLYKTAHRLSGKLYNVLITIQGTNRDIYYNKDTYFRHTKVRDVFSDNVLVIKCEDAVLNAYGKKELIRLTFAGNEFLAYIDSRGDEDIPLDLTTVFRRERFGKWLVLQLAMRYTKFGTCVIDLVNEAAGALSKNMIFTPPTTAITAVSDGDNNDSDG